MATPRKYPTLAEFEELKEAVARIEQSMTARESRRASVHVDAQHIADALGLMDAYGDTVAIGDKLLSLADGKLYTVDSVHIRRSNPGCASVCANLADESNLITSGTRPVAVDMQLMGYALSKKAGA